MANKKPKVLAYKRKREGKTDYTKRLHLLLGKKLRLVVRITNKKIISQIIEFKKQGDAVLVATDSSALKKYKWNFSLKNLPAAYLTGYLTGKKALKKKIKEVILDIGFKPPIKGNRIYAFLKGAVDAGLEVPHAKEVFPSEERISGRHINIAKISESFQQTKKLIEQEK